METIQDQSRKDRIIVIDDDPGIRETYLNILSPSTQNELLTREPRFSKKIEQVKRRPDLYQFDLTLTDRGEKGVEIVRQAISDDLPFVVAFIDMKMPGIDGAETARRIWEVDKKIKIIFVTAYSEYTPDDISRITGRDDSFYLRKPFNPEEIKQFARALSNEWALEREREALSNQLREANSALARINENLNNRVEQQTSMLIQSEKMVSIGILASGVAHEINTPISYVSGNLATLAKYAIRVKKLLEHYAELEEEISKYPNSSTIQKLSDVRDFKTECRIDFILEDISALVAESSQGTEKIQKIVMDLSTFSKLEEAEYKFADLNEIIKATLNMIQNEVTNRANVLTAYGDIPQIKCFPQKLSQVFMNLILNSIQAIDKNGEIHVKTFIKKTGKRTGDKIIVAAVSDNGHGIKPEDIKQLFDPFFTTKPVGEGTGLGLSISYDIVKSHGGQIQVESEVGVGTTFTIEMPIELEIWEQQPL